MSALLKRLPFVLLFITSTPLFAQTDTITHVQYDTVVVKKDPVVVTRNILYLEPKRKHEKLFLAGASLGINYFTALYRTCEECAVYKPYAKKMAESQTPGIGGNVSASVYKSINSRFLYQSALRYSLYSEKFEASSVSARNLYQQLELSASLLFSLHQSDNHYFFMGAGGNLHYLTKATGKTLTIFHTEEVTAINEFRRFNHLMGGVHLGLHWMSRINDKVLLLVHPEVIYQITSLTSYSEYYLQNRFLYSLNLGLLRKF